MKLKLHALACLCSYHEKGGDSQIFMLLCADAEPEADPRPTRVHAAVHGADDLLCTTTAIFALMTATNAFSLSLTCNTHAPSQLGVMRGSSVEASKENLRRVYFGALLMNWRVWTVTQWLSFHYVPPQLRVLWGASSLLIPVGSGGFIGPRSVPISLTPCAFSCGCCRQRRGALVELVPVAHAELTEQWTRATSLVQQEKRERM